MHGRVKWVSRQKGYGFLVDDTGAERFFPLEAGYEVPNEGDLVDFVPEWGPKGPRATQVTVAVPAPRRERDDMARCGACGRQMVPRMMTKRVRVDGGEWRSMPTHSICSFCGALFADFEPPPRRPVGWLWVVGLGALCIVLKMAAHWLHPGDEHAGVSVEQRTKAQSSHETTLAHIRPAAPKEPHPSAPSVQPMRDASHGPDAR